jgi:eukaryotic-like serine/threonine-protein kinase
MDLPSPDSLIGRRLGAYDVLERLGAGGMGEVYRARDAILGRDVALKVLSPAIMNDPERQARFEREARLLAVLNHPNIATIHAFEENAGIHTLVMELVEGSTLAERLAHGPLPVPEVFTTARQIAAALEAAHEKGVIHRDLKPANIKVRPDGTVKVLDFGLAKMCEPHHSSDVAAPTATALGTRAGLIFGTPAYMSPEQARGQTVDKRTDIWAFGCVLYEMLTGRPAFAGATASDTLAHVLERDPDWSRLPAGMLTPPPVRRVLHRCLQKNPKQRLRDIGDARLELDDSSWTADASGTTAPPSGRRVNVAWTAAGLTAVSVMAGVLGWTLKPAVTPAVSRLSHVLPVDVSFGLGPPGSAVTVAPDGSSIVYASTNVLYRRSLSEQEAVPIRGTEGSPRVPFFSPDGLSVGYWNSRTGELCRIGLDGGTPVSLTRATAPYGASWEAEDTILYGQADGIWRVSAQGGTPEQLVRIDTSELAYGPRLLPDGRSLIFSIVTRESMVGQSSAWDTARVVVQSLATGERTEIRRGSDARVLPTGHLIYAQGSALFAVPFDSATRDVRGAPVPIAEGIVRATRGSGGQGGSANYDVSRTGTLVYAHRPVYVNVSRRLLAVDLAGNARPLVDDQRDYWRPRIAPDGTRVALEVLQPDEDTQIWTVDLQRRTATPLSAESGTGYVSWTPDSASVIYRGRVTNLYRQPADGSGPAQALLKNPEPTVRTMDVSREGVVAFASGITQDDIRMLDLASGIVSAFLATPAREFMARFSPDGRWLAYTSNESGRLEVYVRPFPRTEGVARLVSLDGGSDPVWAPDGKALYYLGASGHVMEVPVTPAVTFAPGRPKALFRFAGIYRTSATGTAYDIHPDGKRFIMVSEADEQSAASSPQQVHVVLNWFEELKQPTR